METEPYSLSVEYKTYFFGLISEEVYHIYEGSRRIMTFLDGCLEISEANKIVLELNQAFMNGRNSVRLTEDGIFEY